MLEECIYSRLVEWELTITFEVSIHPFQEIWNRLHSGHRRREEGSMTLKTRSPVRALLLIAGLAVLATAAYVWWGIDDRFVRFAAMFMLVEAVLAAALTIVVIHLGSLLILKLLPPDRRDFYRWNKIQYRAILLTGMLVFLVVAYLLNRYWLPPRLHPASITADIGLFLLVLWALWSVLVPNMVRALILVPGAAVYALLIFILLAVSGGSGSQPEHVSGKKLGALGYVSWVPAGESTDKAGVSWDDEERSFDGFNIYCSHISPSAYLMDMEGNVVHEWSAEMETDEYFGHVELFPEGDVLVTMARCELLLRLDWDSKVVWTLDNFYYHHDMAIAENGDVYLLAHNFELASLGDLPLPILNDYIVVLSPDGTVKTVLSFAELLQDEIPGYKRMHIYRWMLFPLRLKKMVADKRDGVFAFMIKTPLNITHANTVEILDRDYGGAFGKGKVMVCARNLDLIAVVDMESESLLWSWGPGQLDRPHHPTMLDDGNILIFDNGMHRGLSRVIELDPRSGEIVWEFESRDFFSGSRGANQRLPNGNTLITNSNSGQVFEVTMEGEIVWEFYNPATKESFDRKENKTIRKRAAIYRMMRISDPDAYPCLERLQ